MKYDSFSYVAFLAVIGAAAPMAATAADISVSRCNFDAKSLHKPALWITVDGVRTLYKVDENNLTRRIIYDDKRAVAFAREVLNLTDAAANVEIMDTCNDTGYRRTAGEAPVVAPPVVASSSSSSS